MAQEQPQKPEAVKYGDLFDISGVLASKPVAPGDAATMQSAENVILGMTQAGSPATVMKAAAEMNVSRGIVGQQDITDIVRDQGVTITDSETFGFRVITEAVAGQVLEVYTHPGRRVHGDDDPHPITIGEALEATALSSQNKPLTDTDAASIEAAELRATGLSQPIPGGIAAEAQSAANRNKQAVRDEDKIMLGHILSDAKAKLPHDKVVTKEDAEAVVTAEIKNDIAMETHLGGVAASMAAAARTNLLYAQRSA